MTDEEKIKLENKIAFLENTVTIMQQRLKSLGKKYSEDLEKVNGELLKILQLQKENAALRARLDKAVDKELIAKELAEIFDCPCNFTPLDEEMQKYCGDDCIDDSEVCWQRFIEKTVKKRLAELGGEK